MGDGGEGGGGKRYLSIEGEQSRFVDVIASTYRKRLEVVQASLLGYRMEQLSCLDGEVCKISAVQSDSQGLVSQLVQCIRHAEEIGYSGFNRIVGIHQHQ